MSHTVAICAVVSILALLFSVPLCSCPDCAVKPRPVARAVLALSMAIAFARIAWEALCSHGS